MKRSLPIFLGLILCPSISLAGYADGYVAVGEYEYGIEWFTHDPPLIVDGGGASDITVWDSSRIEVRSTSTPVNGNWHAGGILDIVLNHYSELLYLDGVTDLISVYGNSTAVITGGSINLLRSFQNSGALKHITFVCDVDSVNLSGNLLTGNWLNNGGSFSITLLNQSGYDSVYSNIKFIPEPATLALMSLGGLLLRRRKK